MRMKAAFLSGAGRNHYAAMSSVTLAEPEVQVLWSKPAIPRHETNGAVVIDLDRVLCRSVAALVAARPDLIIAEDFGLSTLQAIAYRALRRRTRLLLWVTKPPRLGRLGKFVLSRVDGVLAHSETAAVVEQLGMPTARIFPLAEESDVCAMQAPSFAPQLRTRGPAEAHRLVYFGDLAPQAGVADLLVCAASWAERHHGRRVEIWWIGEGSLHGVLEAQPLPENVTQRFLGLLGPHETAQVFGECGILVMPTLVNDRGSVLAEAMALGLPVLGSVRSRAVRDWVHEGETGWLFDPLSPEQISTALAAALDTPEPRLDGMRDACFARVSAMSPQGLAERIERAVGALLRDALAAGQAPMSAG